ncbi:DUF1853 family protein [Rasiella sp. SM2506]|uniref:DUF1853 family protein n=1 Tax=Rasiella sp. SM2506 TaxID=3423914 RepID=UPI003D7B0EB5
MSKVRKPRVHINPEFQLNVHLKTSPFIYFLKTPELKLPTKEFSFTPFSISEISTEIVPFDFPTEKMLGKQAEFIFESWLEHSQRFQLIAANIQIQGATQTMGELDYIVTDTETNSTLHIELACKFYLLDERLGKTILEQWIGPNKKDRLVDKLEKMKTKQFPLLYREETASSLSKFQLDSSVIQQQYCLKAFLFVPKGFHPHTFPKYFQACLTGFYIHGTELDSEKDENALYTLPQKKEWLLPPEGLRPWISFSEAKKHIKNALAEKRAPLVYKKTDVSIEKFFVVWWDKPFRISV